MLATTTGHRVRVWVPLGTPGLTPDEADAMAAALVEHARYAREQEAASDA